ncbi:hypothetical protein ACSYAD_25630 [Acaryochloris marina NIES-2412]|uniref:hypothetical protein n=1 Tax=Acaryochloris marina TaxID=155978 RepID=UPI004058DC7D
MQSFVFGVIERQSIPQSLVQTIRELGEYKGKQAPFHHQSPQVLETLKQIAIIQSAESSNRIEGIATAPQRLQLLMVDKVRTLLPCLNDGKAVWPGRVGRIVTFSCFDFL